MYPCAIRKPSTWSGMANKVHHRGTHQRRSKIVRDAANANPATRCWACGKTLAEHEPHSDGKPAKWQAGHTVDGSKNPPVWINDRKPPPAGPWLTAEASTCNLSRGSKKGAARRSTGYDWP